jgi:cell division protein FtsL
MRKITVLFLICVLAVAVAVFFNRENIGLLFEQLETKNLAEQKRKQAEERKAELMEEKSRLSTPVGKEQEARKQGYVKEGEITLNPSTTR